MQATRCGRWRVRSPSLQESFEQLDKHENDKYDDTCLKNKPEKCRRYVYEYAEEAKPDEGNNSVNEPAKYRTKVEVHEIEEMMRNNRTNDTAV